MDEDDYYLDRYDCQTIGKPVDTDPVVHPPPTTSRQSSTESGPRSLELEDGQMVPDDEDGYYEDDYEDHLYADTDGAEEYLRTIWSQLGVGDNGYLNLAELYRVCEHIGMSASEEMIEQLFDKLDNDQDGRVSFGEFVDGLFKYVHRSATTTTSTTGREVAKDNSAPSDHQPSPPPPVTVTSAVNNSKCSSTNSSPVHRGVIPSATTDSNTSSPQQSPAHRRLLTTTTNSLDASTVSTGFITLPTDKDGYIESRKILQLWKSLGFNVASTNGERLLKNLGFTTKLYINVYELWAQLEEKLYHASDGELFQICLATFLNEFAQLKTAHSQLTDKCDRLQVNLLEANSRAEFLAAEVDEQHQRLEQSTSEKMAHLEKKYQDQLRIVEAEAAREREVIQMQLAHRRADVERQLAGVVEQLNRTRKGTALMEEENRRLESEVARLKAANGDLQRGCLEMQRQLEEASHLHAKIVELENYESSMEDQRCQGLVEEVERLKNQNKSLQDANDELLAEKDTLRHQLSRQNSVILSSHHLASTTSTVVTGTVESAASSGSRNKRKRRRKKKKKKSASGQMAEGHGEDQDHRTTSENGTSKQAVKDTASSDYHFDDTLSTISTATIDTCTTIDTDCSDFLRSGSRLSRSNSQVEKRQRILLYRNSRHSLDDEPLPVEDAEEVLEGQLWDEEDEDAGQLEVPEEEGPEDDDEDEDEDLEELEEDPRTLIEVGGASGQQHYSSLSEEINEWATSRERTRKSKEALKKVLERLVGGGDQRQAESLEGVLEKIKDGLYRAMVEVMEGRTSLARLDEDVEQVMNDLENGSHKVTATATTSNSSDSDLSTEQLSRLFASYLTASRPPHLSPRVVPVDHSRPSATTTTSASPPLKIDLNNNPKKTNSPATTTPATSSMDWNDN